jgi:hypothetical protein
MFLFLVMSTQTRALWIKLHSKSVGLEIVKKESRVLMESWMEKITRYLLYYYKYTRPWIGLFSSSGLRNCIVFDCIFVIVCWWAIASSVMHSLTQDDAWVLSYYGSGVSFTLYHQYYLEGMNWIHHITPLSFYRSFISWVLLLSPRRHNDITSFTEQFCDLPVDIVDKADDCI